MYLEGKTHDTYLVRSLGTREMAQGLKVFTVLAKDHTRRLTTPVTLALGDLTPLTSLFTCTHTDTHTHTHAIKNNESKF